MATPLCIDTKHGNADATFGLNLCLRDHRGQSGEQVKLVFYSPLINLLSRILNLVGVKIFDPKVEKYVSMYLKEINAHLLCFSLVMVILFCLFNLISLHIYV
jgi:hypothetical protein